jgi:hypothetical protein
VIVFPCTACGLGVRLLEGIEDLESLNSGAYACAGCGGKVSPILEMEISPAAMQALNIRDLTKEEFFAAEAGLGLPEEKVVSLARLNQLLRETPVRSIKGRDVAGESRTIVDELELWDGTRVFLASSMYGATVYRIRPPQSYTNRVLANG